VTQARPAGPIEIVVTGSVETFDRSGVLGRLDYDPVVAIFRHPTPTTMSKPELVDGLSTERGRIALLHDLMGRVHERFGAATMTQSQGNDGQSQSSVATSADPVHDFIGAARGLGIPARYVTGYLFADGEAAQFHNWAEAWDEGLGWIGFDPVLSICPSTEHVRLASGLDAATTMPVRSVPVWSEMPVETVAIEAAQEPST
jgi:hypothetical protein